MIRSWVWFILPIICVGAISILIIYSINPALARSQLIFWGIGTGSFLFFGFFDYRNWQKAAIWIYVISMVALLAVHFIGETVRGSVRWIELGAFRFQPSEIGKVALILILANFFQTRSAQKFANAGASFLVSLPAIILVLIQPDIGNAASLLAIWLGMTILAGFRLRSLFFLLILATFLGMVFYQLLAPYQKERINSFLNPSVDPLKTGYHIIQAKIAVGSGQFLGRGLGRGTQSQLKFLPEAESDFIFASVAEQLGFLGAAILLLFFLMVILAIVDIGKNKDRFAQLLAAGSVSFLMFQMLVNVGMNMELVPVTGITLPLVSYGGSSLISTLFLLSLIFSIKRHPVVADSGKW